MRYAMEVWALASMIDFAFIFALMGIFGVVHGRLKPEPSQRWVVFRETPIRFLLMMLLIVGLACLCIAGIYSIVVQSF